VKKLVIKNHTGSKYSRLFCIKEEKFNYIQEKEKQGREWTVTLDSSSSN